MKQHYNLVEFLKTNSEKNRLEIDDIENLIGEKIYYYGDHFNSPSSEFKFSLKQLVIEYLKLIYTLFITLIYRNQKFDIVSSSYFNVNTELYKNGYIVARPPWSIKLGLPVAGGLKLLFKTFNLKNKTRKFTFNQLVDYKFEKMCIDYDETLDTWMRKSQIKAIIVPNDVAFFERRLIKIAKNNNIPSFVFLHGLPGRYNLIDDNRTDYLIVWGEKIKDNYVKTGFNPDKIIVSGHPNYSLFNKVNLAPINFDDVLVITKSLNGNHHSDGVILGDRGNLILYLLSIEKVLRKLGVNKVRYRPHPSENINWYKNFLNSEFYIPDTETLNNSINQSTLIIGPTSTIFLESLFRGKNYIVYELSNNGLDILNQKLVPPFDGSDENVLIAKTEEELHLLLVEKKEVNQKILDYYFKYNFDLNFTKYFNTIEGN